MTSHRARKGVDSTHRGSVIAVFCLDGTVEVASCEVAPLPDSVTLLVIDPASTPSLLDALPILQEVDAPGANDPLPHGSIAPSLSSLSENGPASVTLPEFLIE